MILLTMILIIAALAIVIIGFVMDRLAIRKMQSGLRTINKRVRKIEETLYPDPIEGLSAEDHLLIRAQAHLAGIDTEDVNYEAVEMDSEMDPQTKKEEAGGIPVQDDEEVPESGS